MIISLKKCWSLEKCTAFDISAAEIQSVVRQAAESEQMRLWVSATTSKCKQFRLKFDCNIWFLKSQCSYVAWVDALILASHATKHGKAAGAVDHLYWPSPLSLHEVTVLVVGHSQTHDCWYLMSRIFFVFFSWNDLKRNFRHHFIEDLKWKIRNEGPQVYVKWSQMNWNTWNFMKYMRLQHAFIVL